jgi:four helix bundle protein
MKNNFQFLDWEVYKDSQEIFTEVSKIVENLPKKLRYNIGDQIIRSSHSVPLNIAEGSGRGTDKDKCRFIDIALGSVNETIAGLDSLRRMDYMDDKEFQRISKKYASISNQLGGLKKYLKNSD